MLMGTELADRERERDLGAIVDSSMKMSTHCATAVKNPNSVLVIIRLKIKQPIL